MRKLLVLALFLSATPAADAANFTLYPGFKDRDALVEMATDKGLIVEIVVRCSRKGNKVKAGILTYSKVERLFCSSKMRCSRDSDRAVDDTCGY